MKILTRTKDQKSWAVLESQAYRAEAVLQELLVESPSIIPMDEIREGASALVVAVKEFGLPGSGNTDVLAFSSAGDIVIIECKLAANPDSKRKVIGQILEYGAYLWGMTYEDLDKRIIALHRRSLADLVADLAGGPDWDEESFRARVRDSLANGSLILVVAVDEVNDELDRTIRFLNECGKPGFSFHALQMRRFRSGDLEVLVPHLHGRSAGPELPDGAKWTEVRFRSTVHSGLSADLAQVVDDLYEWSRANADRVSLGTGVKTGSFTFHYLRDGRTISVFSVYTDGKLTLNYGWMVSQLEQDVMREFHEAIHRVPGFDRIRDDFTKWPSVRLADVFLNRPASVDSFNEAVTSLGRRVHSRT